MFLQKFQFYWLKMTCPLHEIKSPSVIKKWFITKKYPCNTSYKFHLHQQLSFQMYFITVSNISVMSNIMEEIICICFFLSRHFFTVLKESYERNMKTKLMKTVNSN